MLLLLLLLLLLSTLRPAVMFIDYSQHQCASTK